MSSARATCGTSLSDCQSTCPPAGTCPAGCGTTAQTCFAKVGAGAKTCVEGCAAAGPSGLASCLEQCAAQVQSGAAACRAALGTCLVACVGNITGNCFDTMEMRCTDQACSPTAPCTMPNEFCAARCAQPPPSGTCFNRATGQCGASCSFDHPCSADGAFLEPETEICVPVCPPLLPSGTCLDLATAQCGGSCSPTAPCPANQLCVPECPPPPPTGKCFDTVDGRCTDQACSSREPCTLPNEVCTLRCPPPPEGTCLSIATRQCTTQSCSPTAPCPSGEFCVLECPPPTTTTLPGGGCQSDSDCNDGNVCTVDHCRGGVCDHECICATAGGLTCCPGPSTLCVQPCGADASGMCGGFCPPGATCETMPGTTTCGCVATTSCIPFFQPGCSSTSDCCQPCGNGVIAPCAVCSSQGVCVGAP